MKQFLFKNSKNIAIIILIVALLISFQKCNFEKELRASQNVAYNDTVSVFKNKLGTLTSEKKVLKMTNSDLKENILSGNAKLKALTDEFAKVKSLVVVKEKVVIKSIEVPFEVQIPCEFERTGIKSEKLYSFNYKINQNGFNISDLEIPNEQTIITGFKRKWFLGRQTLTTDITNSNESIIIQDVKTIEIVIPKRFYDTRAFNIGVGFIGGALLFR